MSVTSKEEARYAELQQLALEMAREGDTMPLRNMLDAGLPVNLADSKGQTLLMLAAYNGNLETSRMLIGFGADVNKRNDRGQTPLGGVAFKGFTEIAKVLVENGADIDADNGGGMTAWHYASMFGRNETALFLKKHINIKHETAHQADRARWMPFIAVIIGKIRRFFR